MPCLRGNLSYQLNPGIDGVEEGAGRVDELADGRGRGAGDEPEDLLRAGPSHRGPRDPRRPPGDASPASPFPAALLGSEAAQTSKLLLLPARGFAESGRQPGLGVAALAARRGRGRDSEWRGRRWTAAAIGFSAPGSLRRPCAAGAKDNSGVPNVIAVAYVRPVSVGPEPSSHGPSSMAFLLDVPKLFLQQKLNKILYIRKDDLKHANSAGFLEKFI